MKTTTLNLLLNDYIRLDNSSSTDPTDTLVVSLPDSITRWMQLINFAALCGIISFFGVGANITIILVFIRQGFKESVNISLLGLAISDLASSITMFWTSMCYNPLLIIMNLPINFYDVMYVTGGWPHVCFNRITSFITAFITLERCLCIAMPLKVKNIITPFKTKVINACIFLSMIALFSPVFIVNKLEWVYNVSRNRSIYSLVYTDNKDIIDSITFCIHSVALSSVFLLSVSICTIILVVKLNHKSKWRQLSVSQAVLKSETAATAKDKRVVKMIVIISAIFIVCYIPPTLNFLLMMFYKEFRYNGRYQNVFHVIWSMAFVLEAVNSSINVFVYFSMSSKFKITFSNMFCNFSEHKPK